MLKCEKCHERAATVFIKRVLDKQSTQSQLCEECAREQAIADAWLSGAPIPPDASEMPLDELLTELLTSAPDPDAFAPEEDKWSLQKLAAYDQLHSQGEFSSDEDLADEADEMDEDDALDDAPLSPEEIEAHLEQMAPEEREAVSQMLEALDEVQEHLENIMFEHAQDIEGLGDEPLEPQPADDGDAATKGIQSFFGVQFMGPGSVPDEPALPEPDPSEEDDSDEGFFEADEQEDSEDDAPDEERDEEREEPLLPSFLLPGFLGFSEFQSIALPAPEPEPEFKSTPSQRCPKCRTTWDRLREDGRVGCAACYEMFADSLSESLQQVQGASKHEGKSPRAARRRQRRLEMLRARRDSRLDMLRERLKAAQEAQNLDEVAKLQSKIKIVESTIVEPNE